MAVQMLGIKTKFTDDQGRPLVGGSVHTYYAGTSLPQDTFSDPELTVPNTNPVNLDDTGSANIFLKGTYRVRVFDREGEFVEEQDNVDQLATAAEVFKNKGGLNAANERIDVLTSEVNSVKEKTIIVESIADLSTINNPKDGLRVYVKSYHAGLGKGGGYFAYDSSKVDENDGGLIINGWIREDFKEEVVLTDFGALGDGDDATDALTSAINTGRTVWVPEGHYKVRVDNNYAIWENLILESNGARIEIIEGSAAAFVFDISKCNIVRLKGIHFFCNITSKGDNKLFSCSSKKDVMEEFEVSHCHFEGNMSLMSSSASYTQDPVKNPFGFKSFKINDNTIVNLTKQFLSLANFPMMYTEVCRNSVRNWVGVFARFGIANDTENGPLVRVLSNYYVKDNIGVCDDDWWAEDSGSYHCLLLVEGWSVLWEGNTLKGLKSRTTPSVCDAYLLCTKVLSRNNTIYNVATFYKSNNSIETTASNIFFAKSEGNPDLVPYKEFRGNTYVIEKSWLDNIGESSCNHKLFNLGHSNAGIVVMENNYIDVDVLHTNHRNRAVRFQFRNNTVNARGFTKNSEGTAPIFLNIEVAESSGYTLEVDISRNNIYTPIMEGTGIPYFFAGSDTSSWDMFVYKDNYINYGNSGANASIFLALQAHKSVFTGNTFIGNYIRTFTMCKWKDIEYTNNKVIKSSDNLTTALLSQVGIQGNSIINESYSAKIGNIDMYLPRLIDGISPTVDTHFIVNLKYRDAINDFAISFGFALKVVGEDAHIFFTSQEGTQYSNKLGNTSEKLIKTNHTGVGMTDLTGLYSDSGGKPYIKLANLPVEKPFGRFEITLESYPIV